MQQFICRFIDYEIKGNFSKHIHVCMRVSNKNNSNIDIDKYKTVFGEHCSSLGISHTIGYFSSQHLITDYQNQQTQNAYIYCKNSKI